MEPSFEERVEFLSLLKDISDPKKKQQAVLFAQACTFPRAIFSCLFECLFSTDEKQPLLQVLDNLLCFEKEEGGWLFQSLLKEKLSNIKKCFFELLSDQLLSSKSTSILFLELSRGWRAKEIITQTDYETLLENTEKFSQQKKLEELEGSPKSEDWCWKGTREQEVEELYREAEPFNSEDEKELKRAFFEWGRKIKRSPDREEILVLEWEALLPDWSELKNNKDLFQDFLLLENTLKQLSRFFFEEDLKECFSVHLKMLSQFDDRRNVFQYNFQTDALRRETNSSKTRRLVVTDHLKTQMAYRLRYLSLVLPTFNPELQGIPLKKVRESLERIEQRSGRPYEALLALLVELKKRGKVVMFISNTSFSALLAQVVVFGFQTTVSPYSFYLKHKQEDREWMCLAAMKRFYSQEVFVFAGKSAGLRQEVEKGGEKFLSLEKAPLETLKTFIKEELEE